jgi:hypothetical protein
MGEIVGRLIGEIGVGVGGALLIGYQTNWKIGLGAFLLALYARMPVD